MHHFKFYLFVTLAGILAIGIVTILAHYQRDIRAAREKLNHLGSQVIETDCGPIEYARVGDGYPVLVIHGAFGGFDQGLFATGNLIDAGYQVIAVSRFGYLRSPTPENATLDMQVDRFACLLDELNIQQTAVLGLSAGATPAIRFTARYPERVSALILRVPAAPGATMGAQPPKIAFTMMRSDFVYWVLVTYFKSLPQRLVGVPEGFTVPPESEPVLTGLIATTLPSSGRVDGFINDFSINSSALYEEVSETSPYSVYKIEVPVLAISVLDDPLSLAENVRSMAEKFPNARQFVLPDGGHLFLGHSEEAGWEEVQFLQENVALVKNSQ